MENVDQMCPVYKKALADTIIRFDHSASPEEAFLVLYNFQNQYLMFPEYWQRMSDIANVNLYFIKHKCGQHNYRSFFECESVKHFFISPWSSSSKYSGNNSANSQKRIINFQNKLNVDCCNTDVILKDIKNPTLYEILISYCERMLQKPHKYLEKLYDCFHKHSAKPITKKLFLKYEEALKLYKNLEAAGNDDKQWFECWKNVNDRSLIKINFEYRLATGLNAARKNLWKIYINFLKDDPIAMLDIYRRYCRFFISDTEMREKYRYEIERIGALPKAVTKFWIDTIKFEMDFCTLNSAYLMLEKALKAVMKKSYKLVRREKSYFVNTLESYEKRMNNLEKAHFTLMENNNLYDIQEEEEEHALKSTLRPNVYFQNPTAQNLSLPNSVLLFVLKRANHHLLKKFYFSCKYFYALWKVQLCHQIIVHPNANTSYFQQSLFLHLGNGIFDILENIYLTNRLYYFSPLLRGRRNELSKLLKKFYRCDAAYIDITNQDLDLKDFIFLVSSGFVKEVHFTGTRVFNEKRAQLNARQIQALMNSFNNDVVVFLNEKYEK